MLKALADSARKQLLPAGVGTSGPVWVTAAIVMAIVAFFFIFTFRVNPDELGVVMRFGKVSRLEPPGLHWRLPYPIDEVRLPNVTRQNIMEVGIRTHGVSPGASFVRDEALMLTGDENIVDLNFVVYWRVQDPLRYLFSIHSPEVTVRDVAESMVREVVGQSDLQPILTGARQKTEEAVRDRMQGLLDRYGAGIRVDQVRLLKVDPPAQVIDAFRDVQAAAADKVKLQNDALVYSSRVIPEARGEAERILQDAKGYQQQTIAEASGQTARFLKILDEYKKAPDVTRIRLHIETMERVFGSSHMTIMGSKGVVPFISLGPLPNRKAPGN
jgi:modulator of FtsH protease HflK